MKLTHFSIFFLIIILPFSIICRNTMNEYFITLKDQVRLNNVIDVATQDALETLVELNDEFQMLYFDERFDVTQTLSLESIKTFFQTLAVNFNMPYIEGYTETYFSMYVPAIVVVAYDGFFIYSVDETSTNGYAYQISPKIPYAYEDPETGAIINFTLGNYIKLYTNNHLYEGELIDDYIQDSLKTYKEEYVIPFGDESDALEYLPDLTSNMSLIIAALKTEEQRVPGKKLVPSFLYSSGDELPLNKDYNTEVKDKKQDDDTLASKFHTKRREVIINLIIETLQQEINSHETYAKTMGSTYNFQLPEVTYESWVNSINDISVMSFIQGLPIGINSFYNNYALGGSRIVETEYIYATKNNQYHRHDCIKVKNFLKGIEVINEDEQVVDIFVNRVKAAEENYFPCLICRP